MTLTVDANTTVNEMFIETSRLFAKQKVFTEEERVNNFLDRINEIKSNLKSFYPKFDPFFDTIVNELASDISRTDLIARNESLKSLQTLVKKLIKTIESDAKVNSSLKSDKIIIKAFSSDLQEMINDIDRKISPSDKVNGLLDKLSDF